MKNKKTWIIIGSILLLLLVVVICLIVFNKKNNTNNNDVNNDEKKTSLVEEAAKNSGKKASDYKKFLGGEVLNESTYFNEYTFISNNKAYIFDPAKLKNGELSYVKVMDIPENLNS